MEQINIFYKTDKFNDNPSIIAVDLKKKKSLQDFD